VNAFHQDLQDLEKELGDAQSNMAREESRRHSLKQWWRGAFALMLVALVLAIGFSFALTSSNRHQDQADDTSATTTSTDKLSSSATTSIASGLSKGVVDAATQVAAVSTATKDTPTSPTSSESAKQDNPPTASSAIATALSSEEILLNFILPIVGDSVLQEGAPERLAVQWIAQEETKRTYVSTADLIQRFLLVSFYYSKAKEKPGPWLSCSPMADEESATTASSCIFQRAVGTNTITK
jgi:high-affinity Fe2+/Pb2+ permease